MLKSAKKFDMSRSRIECSGHVESSKNCEILTTCIFIPGDLNFTAIKSGIDGGFLITFWADQYDYLGFPSASVGYKVYYFIYCFVNKLGLYVGLTVLDSSSVIIFVMLSTLAEGALLFQLLCFQLFNK